MKILKIIGFGLLILIAIPLIIALFVSNDMNYEKSINIDAPIEVVWENVNSLSDLDKWSPLNEYDPNMQKKISGTDGTVGAKQEWESDVDEVGKGSQTITKLDPPNLIETDLKFYTPYESEAKGYVKLVEEGDNTLATWGFDSEMPYPFNVMKVFVDFEELMDEEFSKGLTNLKRLSED